MRALLVSLVLAVSLAGCSSKKKEEPAPSPADPSAKAAPPAAKKFIVGLVTDVGGRGDQSFNDSALRGLEAWAAGMKFNDGSYRPLGTDDRNATLPTGLQAEVLPLPITPKVLQSKAQEDYEPNLELLVESGADLVVGVGFMLENAVEGAAKRNPSAKFLLIDSPLLDEKGKPYTLPNVKTVVFREDEGSFLVGALAGLLTQSGKVGFVGGMEIPLIKKFEAGFRQGVATTNPTAGAAMLIQYTGSFDNVAAGKQVAQDLYQKGADIVFHAAGSDGQGVIAAAKEARAAGKKVYAIGVDSDQAHLAPDAVLTSMVKRVDLAVYRTVKSLTDGTFKGGDEVMGLKEGGVTYAPVRVELGDKAAALGRVEELRGQVVSGGLNALKAVP